MQQRSRTDNGQPNTKRTERVNHRLPLQNQGQTPIQYFFYFNIWCIADGEFFNVAFGVMDFMQDYNLSPSDALVEEYRQSKTTKALNRFPSKEDWMKIMENENWQDDLEWKYRSKIIKIK